MLRYLYVIGYYLYRIYSIVKNQLKKPKEREKDYDEIAAESKIVETMISFSTAIKIGLSIDIFARAIFAYSSYAILKLNYKINLLLVGILIVYFLIGTIKALYNIKTMTAYSQEQFKNSVLKKTGISSTTVILVIIETFIIVAIFFL